jgi:acyl-CoA synthetase (AMP-forming)/AMP-acid ligase II
VGELYIAGANVGRGYLNNPELTAERFRSNFYRSYKSYRSYISKKLYKTGDLARWLHNSSIEFIGRVDYQVKIRGFRIEPGEVERALLEITAVKEVVVIDGSDDKGDKYLCAYLVSPEELNASDLKDALSLSLPDYMIPTYFVQVDRIPLTPNGKINRKALPEPGLKTRDTSTYIAPGNEIEKKLARIWAEVLDLESDTPHTSISIDADFFELGGIH